MNTTAKGTRNEHRSITLLEATSYRCTRAVASLGAWDIIGIGSTDVVLVQVKTRAWPTSRPWAALSYSRRTEESHQKGTRQQRSTCGAITPW